MTADTHDWRDERFHPAHNEREDSDRVKYPTPPMTADPLPPETLAELSRLLEAATPGPWEWKLGQDHDSWGGEEWRLAPGILLVDGSDGTPGGDSKDRANATLIALAPSLARAVLAERARADAAEADAEEGWADAQSFQKALARAMEQREAAEADLAALRAEVERLREALLQSAASIEAFMRATGTPMDSGAGAILTEARAALAPEGGTVPDAGIEQRSKP